MKRMHPLVEKYADKIPMREGWDAQYWSPIQGAEHLAVRDGVGLIDWSAGIAPIEVTGAGSYGVFELSVYE